MKWDLSPLFSSTTDPRLPLSREELVAANRAFIKDWEHRQDYLQDPAALREALDAYEKLQREYGTFGNEGYYLWLQTELDQNNPTLRAQFARVQEEATKLGNEIQFFTHRLAHVSSEQQQVFLSAPELRPYKHFLEQLFIQAKYLLSESEEKIVNLKALPASENWVQLTEKLLAKETVRGKTVSELLALLSHKNKKTRDAAAKALHGIFAKTAPVAEAEMNAILLNKKIDDTLRHIDRPELSRHLSDDIESSVVNTMVGVVHDHFHLAHQYYALKATLFGLQKLAYHERSLEYGEIKQKYTYKQAVTLVHDVFTALDPEFGAIFDGFVKHDQIDVMPAKGKSSGAFCAVILPIQPTYILLNFTGKLRDVTTIAHEAGHGINNELMKKKVHALDFGTPLSTAEVASTFMEDFVLERLLQNADDETRLALLMEKLDADISTIIRQVACYQFELELHAAVREQGYLSEEAIGKLFQKHMASYMGESVQQSEGSQNWWVYWSHIRRFFYVYSYASGMLISKSLQAKVRANHEFIHEVKEFLSAGTSDSPKNIFKKLGIDLDDPGFWKQGMGEIQRLLEETTALAHKLHKI